MTVGRGEREDPMPYKPFLLLSLALMLWPGHAETGEYHCKGHDEIIVTLESPAEVESVCSAAGKALDFLARYDLHPKRTIRLNIVERSIMSEGNDAYGSYDIQTEIISLMSYQAILASVNQPKMYGEPFDEAHYAGAVAHEVAHAVMHHNLMYKHISQAPQEYIAHATQLAVLPVDRRNTIIRTMDVDPWASGDAISDVYMAMEPGKFAVKSYEHLTTMDDPKKFIGILLKSKWFYVYVP